MDDEQLARDELSFLLKEFPEVEVLATAKNGLEAIQLIENLEPDVVFLDVQMPGLDGLAVIQKLREKNIPLPHFILATAYDHTFWWCVGFTALALLPALLLHGRAKPSAG